MSEMTLGQVRAQIHAFATTTPRTSDYKTHYVEMNVGVMDDWWKTIDTHLAQPAEAVDVYGLKDPVNVHAMMLRGLIAIPTIRSMVDLRGEVPNGEDVQLARIAELQEQVETLTRIISGEKAGPVGEIPLDDCVRSILGKPCFTLIHLANALRKDGHKIGHKAEDEQAVCLHWMLNLYLKHGTEWGKVATAEIERIHALPASPAPNKEGV